MSRPFSLLLCCLISLLPVPSGAAPHPRDDPERPARSTTIAVADFSGEDPELGRFLADTLLTDLGQSTQLHLVERTEIRRALEELKLQSTGLFAPEEAQALGRMVRADGLIVGSFYVHDSLLIVNARLLDVQTGRLAPGGSANVSGDSRNLLPVMHRLAHLFHRRVTGTEFVLDGEGAPPASPAGSSANRPQQTDSTPSPTRSQGTSGSGASGYRIGQRGGNPNPTPTHSSQTISDIAPYRTRESALSQRTLHGASPPLQDTYRYIESVRASLALSVSLTSIPPLDYPFSLSYNRVHRGLSVPKHPLTAPSHRTVFRLSRNDKRDEKYLYRCR